MSFEYLSEQSPQAGRTARFVLPLRAPNGPPVLHVEHLGETNTGYYMDALSKATAQDKPRPRDLNPQALAQAVREARNRRREVVAVHCVRKLENVYHRDGREAGAGDVVDLVWALPDDVFDSLWDFASDPANFRTAPIEGDPVAIAGK